MKEGRCFVFDPVIYPNKLIILVGADYEYVKGRFSMDDGDPMDDINFEDYPVAVSSVRDSDGYLKILVRLDDPEALSMRTTCHEALHVVLMYCRYCNMGVGLNVGEDEHAAYIAGWFGKCVSDVLDELENERHKGDERPKEEDGSVS